MLRTFDENLVITAVQQLTTDLDSLSVRIKKLEDNGGGSPKLIVEKIYENVEITDTTEQPFDIINLGNNFLLATNEILIIYTNYDTDHANPKTVNNMTYFTNLSGVLTGTKNKSGIDLTYYTAGGTLTTQPSTTFGIYGKTLNITNKTIEICSKYASGYGYMGGTVTIQVYKVQMIPSYI